MKLFALALISALALATTSVASPVGGAQRASDELEPGQVKGYTIVFKGSEPYRIAAISEGAGDLDCFLFDENENLITKDDDETNTCLLEGTPARTGVFHLILRNAGKQTEKFATVAQ